jgi:hypothetical protein
VICAFSGIAVNLPLRKPDREGDMRIVLTMLAVGFLISACAV